MATLLSNPPSRRYERGGISWVTALLLVAAVSAAYLLVTWVPIYFAHYAVKQTVRDYMNQAIKNRNDDELIAQMCQKLASLESVTVVDANGVEQREPAVKVTPADVTWERDTSSSSPMLHVAFEYTRQVEYPYLSKVTEWVGSVDLNNELTIPDWGPAR
jgi:hypothetical protein